MNKPAMKFAATTGRASEWGHCTNGGCTKPLYRGTECFRCWAGTKWDSMKQRIENRRGQYPQWAGKTLTMTRRDFIDWALDNPPPPSMQQPSVDRINPESGYSLDNVRWMEARQNSRNRANDVPLTHRRCTQCSEVKQLTPENFHRNRSNPLGFNSYCRACRSRLGTTRKSA